MPLLCMFWLFLFIAMFRKPLISFLSKTFPNAVAVGDIDVNEDIDNYFRCIDDNDRNWSIKEEENARKNLHMELL